MTSVTFGEAAAHELEAIVELLHDDPLGAARESTAGADQERYRAAFEAIHEDANNVLIVGRQESTVVAVAQLTFLPSLTYGGTWRAQIEGVRVAAGARRHGIGRQLIEHLIELARARRCGLVQLTTDKRRPEALAFYERLGFTASHEGMKLRLEG